MLSNTYRYVGYSRTIIHALKIEIGHVKVASAVNNCPVHSHLPSLDPNIRVSLIIVSQSLLHGGRIYSRVAVWSL